MESYGLTTAMEEPVWQLGLESYPERPDEADCIYYLRTGFCGFGSRCRFNHPRDRSSVVGALRAGSGEYPERAGQPLCQYYMRTGTCKFGASCKYHHPRLGGGSAIPVALNISGYPLRPGEKECSYYVKTGQCKFGVTCKFHHPQPAGIQVPPPTAIYPSIQSPSVPSSQQYGGTFYPSIQSPSVPSSQQYGGNWPVANPVSYLQGAYSPMMFPQGMVPLTGWNPYQAPVSQVASVDTQSTASVYGITHLSPSAPAYTGAYLPLPSSVGPPSSSLKENTYPERPGQPECQHYMRSGECKFGSSCRYHHPPEWSTRKTNLALSPMGLPLRPGAPVCIHFAQNGVCNFGPSCKFDHPIGALSYSPSASSLADMPVAPYPVGSSKGTLAPSSSSSDLRPELNTGSNKDALSTRMSSSMIKSSGSVGSIFSDGGSASQPSVQQSGRASAPSTSSSSTSHGGEFSKS